MAKAKKKFNRVQRLEDVSEKTLNETVAAVKAATNPNFQLSMAKICRLCEAKDGPFLNIFGADSDLIKRIEQLLPITVKEDDELPHKICFRCSAKVEELHIFTKRCIQAQQNLSNKIGKSFGSYVKTKRDFRSQWEEKLNKSKLSNEDICNEMVLKAMKGISSDIDVPDLKEMLKETKTPLMQPPRPFTPPTEMKKEEPPKREEKRDDTLSYEVIRDAVIKKAVESIANIDLATLQAKRLELIKAQGLDEGKSNQNLDSVELNGNDKDVKQVSKSGNKQKTNDVEQVKDSNSLLDSNKQVKVSLEKLNEDKRFSGPTRSTRHSKIPEPEIETPEKITPEKITPEKITRKTANKEKAKNDAQKDVESPKVKVEKETRKSIKQETINETRQIKTNEVSKEEIPTKSKKSMRKEQKRIEAEETKRRNEEEKRRKEEEKRREKEEKRRIEEEKLRKEEEKRLAEEEIMKHVSCIRVGGVGELFTCQLCKRNFLKKEGVLTHVCQKAIPKPIIPPPREPSPEPLRTPTPPPKKAPVNEYAKQASVSTKKKPGPASKTKNVPPQQPMQESISINNDSMISMPTLPFGANLSDPNQKRYKLVAGPHNSFMLVEDPDALQGKPGKANTKKSQKSFERNNTITFNPSQIIDLDDQDEPNEILPDLDDSYRRPYPVGLISAVQTPDNMAKPKLIEHSYSIKPSKHPNKIVISAKQDPPETAGKKTKGKKRKQDNTTPDQPYSLLMEEVSGRQSVAASKMNMNNPNSQFKPTYLMPKSTVQESQISTSSKNRYRCTFCLLSFSRQKKLDAHMKEHEKKFADSSDEEVVESPRFFKKKRMQ